MSIGQANCAVCGGKIVYFQEAQTATCDLCGKEDMAHCICEHGHYVCDACHRSNGVEACINYCLASSSKNPIEIAQAIMDDRSIYPNGPEHHTLEAQLIWKNPWQNSKRAVYAFQAAPAAFGEPAARQ